MPRWRPEEPRMSPKLLSSALPAIDGGPQPVLLYRTLPGLLSRSMAAYGNRRLFGTKSEKKWRWTSYSAFGRLVERMRGGLASLGIGRGDTVAIIAGNRLEWAVCAYATYGLGAASVPMYETQTDKEWEYILRDSDAKAVFVSSDGIRSRVNAFRHALPELSHLISIATTSLATPTYDDLLLAGDARPAKQTEVEPKDLACLIYTSGTTGEPKGVMLTHANIVSNLSAVQDLFPIGNGDKSLSFLPWAHAFGHTVELHCMLSMGGSIAVCEGVERLVQNLAEVHPTVLFAVPKIFNRIYNGVQKQISEKPPVIQRLFAAGLAAARRKHEGERLTIGEKVMLLLADKLVFSKIRKKFGGKLRFAIAGGAKLETEVARFIDGLGIEVHEGYGLTETSPIVSANSPRSRRMSSVGKPVPGVRIEISAAGEILVRGPNVMAGYHGLPEETAAVFTADGAFRTGDMGRIDDGFLFITGRIKEQYKLENGKYVVPSPLEEQLKLSPFIANVIVFGDNKPHNVALIVPDQAALAAWASKEGLAAKNDALLEEPKVRELFAAELKRCSAEFKGYEKIMKFALILEDFTQENGMLTPTLKLKRRTVLDRWGAVIDSLYT